MTRVLILDDDEINNFTIEAMLQRTQFVDAYEIQDSGAGALEYLREAEASDAFPNHIFVDINMPTMDGYQFLNHYENKHWKKHPETNIYMLSSSISESDRERSLSFACVTEYITKPLSRSKLQELVHD